MSTVLTNVTSVLEWMITSFTDITTWLIGNELGGIYVALFIIGGAVGMMYRILHSA